MESSVSDFVLFLGRFHPVVVHFPIGFLFFAFIMEVYGRRKRIPQLTDTISLALLSGAISALLACILGYMLSLSGDYEQSALDTHFWFGVATTVLTFFAWAIRSNTINIPQLTGLRANSASLTLIVVLVGATGHYGGDLTHGEDYLVKYAPFGKAEKVVLPPIAHLGEAGVYDYLAYPILEAKCISCHNSSKKKGGLSLQDSIAIMEGGDNGDALVPGDASRSDIIKRVLLLPSHEDHMPPKGKTPLTDEEKAILTFWIEQGEADFKVKVAELETPDEILGMASNILGLENTGNRSTASMPVLKKVDEGVIQEIVTAGFHVRELVFGSNLYEVVLPKGSVTSGSEIQIDEKLAKLLPIKDHILWLSLKNSGLTDKHLETIGGFINLQKLEIQENPITDHGIAAIVNCADIVGLNLLHTRITKSSLETFTKMGRLERVYVLGTGITDKDVLAFGEGNKLPEIIFGL